MLRARLFGRLRIGGPAVAEPLPVERGRARALLAFLLAHPGQHPRSSLAGRFWPEVPETSARASLRTALWSARAALDDVGAGEWLETTRSTAGLSDRPRDIDLERAEGLLAGTDAEVEEALSLTGAPLLADVADEWVIEERERLAELRLRAMLRLSDAAAAERDRRRSVAWARRAVGEDRLSEAAHRALIDRLVDAGERAEALAAYRRCAAVLRESLGIEPGEAVRAAAERARAGRPPEPEAPPPPEPPPPTRPSSAPGGAPASAAELTAAARKATLLGARAEAERLLVRALEVVGADGPDAPDLVIALGRLAAERGAREESDARFALATASLAVRGEALGLAEAHVEHARCLQSSACDPRAALRVYREAAAALDATDAEAPELRALVLAGTAWAEAMGGDPAPVEDLIARSEALAGDDAALASELREARAAALARTGRAAESEDAFREAAGLAERAGRPVAAAPLWLAAAAMASAGGDFEGSLRGAERGLAVPRCGPALELALHAARAQALIRLGRRAEAVAAIGAADRVRAEITDAAPRALADVTAGSTALAAGDPAAAVPRLEAALAAEAPGMPRALARVRLAEARLALGDDAGAARELSRLPFEPVGPADQGPALVHRVERIEGLLAAGRGERAAALSHLAAAEDGWRRLMDRPGATGEMLGNVAELGRTPVAGLLQPAMELALVLTDRAELLGAEGDTVAARAAVREATGLASASRDASLGERLIDLEEELAGG